MDEWLQDGSANLLRHTRFDLDGDLVANRRIDKPTPYGWRRPNQHDTLRATRQEPNCCKCDHALSMFVVRKWAARNHLRVQSVIDSPACSRERHERSISWKLFFRRILRISTFPVRAVA